MKNIKNNIWLSTALIAVILSVITFTPVIIPENQFKPELGGMPYSLWTGIVIMILFILNTILAAFVHPGDNNDR